MSNATLKYSLKVGNLIKGHTRQEIRAAAFQLGLLSCDLEEERGLIKSALYVTVTGDEASLQSFQEWFDAWVKVGA